MTEETIGVMERRVRALVPMLLALLLALAVPFAAYSLVGDATRSHIFLVRDVNVSDLERLSEADVLRLAGLDRARNVLMLDPHEIQTRLESEPWVREASVEIDFRALTVQIDVAERELAAVVADGVPLLVDVDGAPIRTWSGDALQAPVIVGVPVTRDETGQPHADARRLRDALSLIDQAAAAFPTRRIRELHHRGAMGFTVYFDDFEIALSPDQVDQRLGSVRTAIESLERRPLYAIADSTSPHRVTFGFTPVPSEER